MSLMSMTGFGRAESHATGRGYRVEIRSVNNRFLDIQMRTSRSMNNLEQKIKEIVSNAVSRGTVSVFISAGDESDEGKLSWKKDQVDEYISLFREIQKTYNLRDDITLSNLIQFSDFIYREPQGLDESKVWRSLKPVMKEAIDDFQLSRKKEGLSTERALKKNISSLNSALSRIEKRAPQRLKKYRTLLQERIQTIIGSVPEPQRLAMEFALMADKLDITEECSRLRAHIAVFAECFTSNEPVGKRMNFLVQEMNREANTIGAKANDTTISHISVTLKDNIEKLREHIQNIE